MNMTKWMQSAFCALLLTLPAASGAWAKNVPQRVFQSADSAAAALVQALRNDNRMEVLEILGPGAQKLLESGDTQADQDDRRAFVRAYEAKHALTAGSDSGKGGLMLVIGENDWPFPIPLVSGKDGLWRFDSKRGAEEILNRRIGRNELAAMRVCLAYVDAQRDYYALNPEHAAAPCYARKIASTPGKRDGLYWETSDGEAKSPLGALLAQAESRGGGDAPGSYYGYRYRILDGQGKSASGGARGYAKDGLMSEGFALVAYPEIYGKTGVMSFIVNQDGVVYEKNLGKESTAKGLKMKAFDPDSTWRKAELP